MWLTEDQIRDLTGKKQRPAQIRVLAESGVPFRVINGRPIVVASNLEQSEKKVRRLA